MQLKRNKVLSAVLRAAERYSLVRGGDRVVVGLSGGADSMCLTHALCALREELGIEVAAAHLNHNIRGEAALSDAAAAERFARSLGIEFFLRSEDVRAYAKRNSMSEELAGRSLRYAFFDELCKKHGYTRIATAHNRNDSAETLVMNFVRGSGLPGLCGIPPVRGNIIRPLIEVSRGDIEEYCRENSLPYVTDATNLEAVYTRNRIRLEIMPQLAGLNANFINTVTTNARLMADENDYLDAQAGAELGRVYDGKAADAAAIAAMHPAMARRVIRLIARDVIGELSDISSRAAEDILALCAAGRSGKRADVAKGFTAQVSCGRLVIGMPESRSGFDHPLEEGRELVIPEAGIRARLERCDKRERDGAVYLSCDDMSDIRIRSRQEGDVFFPSGMSGRKKLKEFFIDRKIPSQKRGSVPIITIGGEIAAVADMRADRRYLFGERPIGIKIYLKNNE